MSFIIINIMREWSFKFLDRPVDNRKCGPAVLPAAIGWFFYFRWYYGFIGFC